MKPDDVKRLADDHEFQYSQLAALFGQHKHRIRSYVFASLSQKRRLMGAGRTFIAKPWRNEMYLQFSGFPQRALKHELAHIMAAPHGDRFFGISLASARGNWRIMPRVNIGLVEGLAVAADWPPAGELSGHQQAAALLQLGLAPPLGRLMGLGFFGQAGPLSYQLAGSFCRFLWETSGKSKLLALYGSAGDFQETYGEGLPELIKKWRAFLNKKSVSPYQLQLTRAHYSRPSIFSRVCPHAVANLRSDAMAARRQNDHRKACAILQHVAELDPGNPYHRWTVLRAQAEAGNLPLALKAGTRLLAHPKLSKPLKRRTLAFIGDLWWKQNRPDKAAEYYRDAAAFAAGPGGRRNLAIKRWALGQGDPVRKTVLDYLARPGNQKRDGASDVHATHQLIRYMGAGHRDGMKGDNAGLGYYLLAKALANRALCREALPPIKAAIAARLKGSDLQIEAHRVLGRCAYLEGDYPTAREAFEQLRNLAGKKSGVRIRAQRWLARVKWKANQTSPTH